MRSSLISNRVRKAVRTRFQLRRLIGLDQAIDVSKLGSSYGGWCVGESAIDEDSVCYLFGAGEDISFDCELARKFGAEVHVFDPTPRAAEHFRAMVSSVASGKTFGPSGGGAYELDAADLDRIDFHEVGVWSTNGSVRLYAPEDPSHVSHSALNLQGTVEYFDAPVSTIGSLMKELDHTSLDLVKLDVEGAEYEALRAMIDDGIRPVNLLIEFDEVHSPLDNKYGERIRALIGDLREIGYSVVHVDGCNAYLRQN